MQPNLTDTLRQSVSSVLGAPPDPAPLLPQVLSVTAQEGYIREHIKYQVSPGDWSYAYLLIPNNLRASAPAILCHHQHNNQYAIGKNEMVGLHGDEQTAPGVELVRRGYIVFAPDALGFGERRDPNSRGLADDTANTFHQLSLRLLRGETLLRKITWDLSRALDYLETRSEVDSRFIGFLGNGYGGRVAAWLMAFEPRIRAAAAHTGLTTYRETVRRGKHFQIEFVVPRLMQVADLHHLIALCAPRPFLLSTAEHDPEGADAAEIYQKALSAYQNHGVAHKLTLYQYPGDAGFDRTMRYHAYQWLDNWLLPY